MKVKKEKGRGGGGGGKRGLIGGCLSFGQCISKYLFFFVRLFVCVFCCLFFVFLGLFEKKWSRM